MQEIQADLKELKYLHSLSRRQFAKTLLQENITKLEQQIEKLKAESPAVETTTAVSSAPEKKRYVVEVTNYAWDQSPKYVKLYVTINGVQVVDANNVSLTFTGRSVNLLVKDFENKDYSYTVNNLLENVIEDKSYHKIKTDMIVVYLKKEKEGNSWDHLTTTTKRLKDAKIEEDIAPMTNNSDPGAGLMEIMKKMYESGDAKTKQMINKVWAEQQDKKSAPGGLDDFAM